MKLSAPGDWTQMTRLASRGQPSQNRRHVQVSSPGHWGHGVSRESTQNVRIGFLPDLIVRSLGAAAAIALANAPAV